MPLPDSTVSSVVCNKMKCSCQPGAFLCGASDMIDLSDLIREVTGPAKLSCRDPAFDGGRYNCVFDEPVLRENLSPILGSQHIELDCLSGECMYNLTQIPNHSVKLSQIGANQAQPTQAGK